MVAHSNYICWCRLARALAARINGTQTTNRACTWDSDTVMNVKASLCKFAYSQEPPFLAHKFPFQQACILELRNDQVSLFARAFVARINDTKIAI